MENAKHVSLQVRIDRLRKNLSERDCLILYTCAFALLAAAVFLPFWRYGKSLIWNSDGLTQHYTAVLYIRNWALDIIRGLFRNHTLTIPIFDFSIGMGGDVLTTFAYYGLGEPLNLLYLLIPTKMVESMYGFLILFRLYLAGLFFYQFCRRYFHSRLGAMIGSFGYAFCGYALFAGVRHPFFLIPMMGLPLLLLGAQKILDRESPLTFILALAVFTLSNFYFAYVLVLLTVIFVAVRFFTQKHDRIWRELGSCLGRFLLWGSTGLLLAGVLLLPVILVYLNAARADVTNAVPFLYPRAYYETLIAAFGGYASAGFWNNVGYLPLTLLSLFFVFIKKGEYRPYKIGLAIMILLQLFPAAGSLFNGFSYVANRWTFAVAFMLCFTMVAIWPRLRNLSVKEKRLLTACTAVYLLVVCLVNSGKNQGTLTQLSFLVGSLLLLVGGDVLFSKTVKEWVTLGVAALSIASIICSSGYLYAMQYSDYSRDFLDAKNVGHRYKYSVSNQAKEQLSTRPLARYDCPVYDLPNQPVLSRTNGSSYYWSLNGDRIGRAMQELGLNQKATYYYNGWNRCSYLETLAGVTDFLCCDDSVPYGYVFDSTVPRDDTVAYLYKNPEALPLGYTYDSYLTREQYDALSPLQKQEALMQAAVLEQKPEGITPGAPAFSAQKMEISLSYSDSILQQNGGFYATKNNVGILLTLQGLPNTETYLCIKGLQAESYSNLEMQQATDPMTWELETSLHNRKKAEYQDKYYQKENYFPLDVRSDQGVSSKIFYGTDAYPYYNGQTDFAVNLGYSSQPVRQIHLTLPKRGFYSWEDLSVYCLPMNDYGTYVQRLSRETLQNVTVGTNEISGTVDLQTAKVMCLAIPYTKGWSATVDGKPAELLPTNTWCMGLVLGPGHHTVQLTYRTPGLVYGIAATLLGGLLTVTGGLIYRRRKKRK